ncbi:OmpA family protein [Winogradskyella wichelsiae]|uniref:OmpA family protein n=1 Tax=Winogradskyella wichelsiae TaxID=2697007 RepID=UPI0015C9F6B0|nr:OmpA family protein [Winogradskyella wichelsiae]
MNTYIYKIILCFLSCLFFASSFAQIGKLETANAKYDKYQFIDAREIYLKVVANGYRSAEIYRKLSETYYFNSEYSGASKWYYKLINEFPNDLLVTDYFRASQCFKSAGDLKEAERLMKLYETMGGKPLTINSYKNVADTLFEKGVNNKLFELNKISVNTEYSDFGTAFYGNKIVFASSGKSVNDFKGKSVDLAGWDNQPFLDLYEVVVDENMNLKKAELLKGDVNTKYHECTAVFSKDGNTMYFTRNNFLNGKKKRDKDFVIRLKMYKATKTENTWGNVIELPFNGDSYSIGHPALNPKEDRLYFASDMPGTYGMSDLWYVDILEGGTYSEPVNMGAKINTVARETFPSISTENNLYFSSTGHEGLGGLDIFLTKLNKDSHGEIATLGEPINSTKDDFGFVIKEGRIGYFTSNRDGEEGSRGDDIYQMWERCEIKIQGPVTDEDTGALIPNAEVTLLDSNNNEILSLITGDDALFTLTLDCNERYIIRAHKEGYNPKEEIFETPKNPKTIEMPIVLNMPLTLKLSDPCLPNDLGCKLTLQPIYFDYDQSDIRIDAEIELAKIVAALKEYPQLKIDIESHTDSRGRDAHNLRLSKRRAKSTLHWFYDNGIARNRLSATGYGESQLINNCVNNAECSEEEHQLNRRSIFIIRE